MTRLTFVWAFNAMHRLWTDRLDEAENLKAYGECANPAGHGHQYRLEVTLRVKKDEVGVPRRAIERTINEVLAPSLHNADLNETFSGEDYVSTGENVVQRIWQLLADGSELAGSLHEIRLIETPKNSFTFRGAA